MRVYYRGKLVREVDGGTVEHGGRGDTRLTAGQDRIRWCLMCRAESCPLWLISRRKPCSARRMLAKWT